jgi:hypothetical protein
MDRPLEYQPKDHVITDARQLSSGTMADLTGLSRYDQVDPVQFEFVEFCEETPGRWQNWQEAWRSFAQIKGFSHE